MCCAIRVLLLLCVSLACARGGDWGELRDWVSAQGGHVHPALAIVQEGSRHRNLAVDRGLKVEYVR